MKNVFLLTTLLSAILFLSCEKVIPAKDLPEQDARMVVNCLLYNDSAISANLTLSKSIVSNKKFKTVDNALCHVMENDIFIGDLTFKDSGRYVSNILPKANKKYTLVISSPSYSNISASTYIPGTFSVSAAKRYDTLNYTYRVINYNGSSYKIFGGECRFRMTVYDTSLAKNYFSIKPRVEITDSLGNTFSVAYNTSIFSTNTSNTSNTYYSGNTMEFDDLSKVNGNEIPLDFSVGLNFDLQNFGKIKSYKIYLYMSSLSEEYYRYKLMLDKQYSAGVSFFAEPVLQYSNVSNNMGIVAGANISTFRIY
ncbi:MAG: DUF4249 domain-containing protein [Bacteroidia bacterium]|nr:DUF4249 domain-containing protein [Bacteroidia bacterium]